MHLCDAMELAHHCAGVAVTVGFMFQRRGMFGFMTGCMVLEYVQ